MGRQGSRLRWIAATVIALAAMASAVKPAHAADAPSAATVIRGGFSAAGGLSAAGPYAAILVYDLPDAPPAPLRAKAAPAAAASAPAIRTTAAPPPDARPKAQPSDPQESLQIAAALGAPRRLVLATREGGKWQHVEIARADRIDGPVCPKETVPGPILAWTQRQGTQWELCIYREGKKKTVASGGRVMHHPLIAFSARSGLIAGCETDDDKGESVITLYDESGARMLSIPGRHGRLAAAPAGLLLLAERATADAIWLEATAIKDGKSQQSVAIRGPRDYTFNADIAVDPASGAAFIVAECAVAFGAHCQLGLDRELRVWRLAPDVPEASPYPDAARALLPIERRAFRTGMGSSTENTPPIRPIILSVGGRPLVAFREFRCRAKKDFGWDVYLTSCTGPAWSAPVRLTEQIGSADTGYALLPDGAGFLGVFPELDNPGRSSPSYAHRVALVTVPPDRALLVPPIPEAQQNAAWRTPERFLDIAPAPPALPSAPDGLTLLWGDLHAHSIYSKCIPSANGTPDEMLRYERDVLKLDVIALLEHTQFMSLAEVIWDFDRLEAEAGGRILLYGTEPGIHPGRHTNIHATSRGVFDRICSLCRVKGGSDRAASYRALLEAFPDGQTVAIRHFHGDTDIDNAESATSFEPRLEVAMEAMQGRANNLLGNNGKAGFPSNYLNHGFKIGLVGGSDHFRETEAVNRYCLTGFWVRERSAAGIWEALRNRRTLAVSNAKVAIWATLEGKSIGEEVAATGPLRFHVALAAARPIRRVTLIRDGEVLPWTAVGAKNAALTLEDKTSAPGRHWYVVTAEADSAYPQPAIAHASPIFVTVKQ